MNARTNKPWCVTAIHNKPGVDSYITEYRVDTLDGRQTIVRMTGTDAEDRDNAELIAAAPELYSAGKSLLDCVEAAIAAGDWKVDGACDPESAITAMRAALAKVAP